MRLNFNNKTASVYKQKVYDYVDTVVGYQFVDALYRGRRGQLKVDLALVNGAKEQKWRWKGGEPLTGTGRKNEAGRESRRVASGAAAQSPLGGNGMIFYVYVCADGEE